MLPSAFGPALRHGSPLPSLNLQSQSLPSPMAATWVPSSPRTNLTANGFPGDWWIFSIFPRRSQSHSLQHGKDFTRTQLNQQELSPLLPYIRRIFKQDSDPYTEERVKAMSCLAQQTNLPKSDAKRPWVWLEVTCRYWGAQRDIQESLALARLDTEIQTVMQPLSKMVGMQEVGREWQMRSCKGNQANGKINKSWVRKEKERTNMW